MQIYKVIRINTRYLVEHLDTSLRLEWPITQIDFFDLDEEWQDAFEEMYSWKSRKRVKWFQKRKETLLREERIINLFEEIGRMNPYSLDYTSPCYANQAKACKPEKKGDTNMNANITVQAAQMNNDYDKRHYMSNRMYDIRSDLQAKAHIFYKMDPVASPKTLKDFFKKMEEKDYSFDEKILEQNYYSVRDVVSAIRWTKEESDVKGYQDAIDRINDLYTKTCDDIQVLSPEEGLKSLREFEKMDFTG